jgi:hypothetical protein
MFVEEKISLVIYYSQQLRPFSQLRPPQSIDPFVPQPFLQVPPLSPQDSFSLPLPTKHFPL